MERIPDWQLERYALGELSPDRMAAIRARVEAEPELAARLDALRADDAAFLAAWPARRVVPGLLARAEAPVSRRWWWIAPVLVAAAATLVARPDPVERASPETAEGEPGRVKGLAPALRLYRAAPGGVEELADGAVARAGDVVQVGTVAGGGAYGVVVSLDGRGVVTDHLVGPDGGAAPLGAREDRLASSYELDDAPRFERFFFVVGDAPFPQAVVRSAVERLAGDPRTAPLVLPEGLAQVSITLTKEAP
jgi:hypothetical protein